MKWVTVSPFISLGFLPGMVSASDNRPAQEQFHANYPYGGWRPFKGFELSKREDGRYELAYPGDPPMQELAHTQLREETIILFECDWVAVVQADGTYSVARLD